MVCLDSVFFVTSSNEDQRAAELPVGPSSCIRVRVTYGTKAKLPRNLEARLYSAVRTASLAGTVVCIYFLNQNSIRCGNNHNIAAASSVCWALAYANMDIASTAEGRPSQDIDRTNITEGLHDGGRSGGHPEIFANGKLPVGGDDNKFQRAIAAWRR